MLSGGVCCRVGYADRLTGCEHQILRIWHTTNVFIVPPQSNTPGVLRSFEGVTFRCDYYQHRNTVRWHTVYLRCHDRNHDRNGMKPHGTPYATCEQFGWLQDKHRIDAVKHERIRTAANTHGVRWTPAGAAQRIGVRQVTWEYRTILTASRQLPAYLLLNSVRVCGITKLLMSSVVAEV